VGDVALVRFGPGEPGGYAPPLRHAPSILSLVLLFDCTVEAISPVPTPLPECPGSCLEHDFGPTTLAAGAELGDQCVSWTLNNPDSLWVNSVATANDGLFHHANWFWVPDDLWDVPDGFWDCTDLGFNELGAAVAGGVLYAQSTQTDVEIQQFLDGAALEIRPFSRIVGWTHLLNVTDEALETGARMQLGVLDAADVTTPLSPFRFNYGDLRIPPGSVAQHEGDCDLDSVHQQVLGGPLELKLHYVLPHYHALGSAFRLEVSGGAHDGEVLFEIEDTYGEPLGRTFAEPVDLGALDATGMRFSCTHDNPTNAQVGFGIGDQEMCVMLGFAETELSFDGAVSLTTATETLADGTVLNRGVCGVTGAQL